PSPVRGAAGSRRVPERSRRPGRGPIGPVRRGRRCRCRGREAVGRDRRGRCRAGRRRLRPAAAVYGTTRGTIASRGTARGGTSRAVVAGGERGLLGIVRVVHGVHVSIPVQEFLESVLDVGWTTRTRIPSAGAVRAAGSDSSVTRCACAPSAAAAAAMSAPCGVVKKRRSRAG